ncbi:MAG: hypothetical protein IBJ15_00045 [Alphaproteobacteria bacterium]|nr:hypothetical protein [Alphaproteobacteria bacterium]
MNEAYRVLPSPTFSAGEMRALIAGVKTRHTMPLAMAPDLLRPHPELVTAARNARGNWRFVADTPDFRLDVACDAKFKPGDRLWVRETVQLVSRGPGRLRGFIYRADQHPEVKLREVPEGERDLRAPITATPAHQIPRWASRLVLDVDDVEIRKLHELGEGHAFEEGLPKLATDDEGRSFYLSDSGSHLQGFAGAWAHRHGAASWLANPWVETFRFSVRHENIDGISDALRKGAA